MAPQRSRALVLVADDCAPLSTRCPHDESGSDSATSSTSSTTKQSKPTTAAPEPAKRKASLKRKASEALISPGSAFRNVLSPMRDGRKVTPRKQRMPKKSRQSLEARFSLAEECPDKSIAQVLLPWHRCMHQWPTNSVALHQILEEAYQEQEEDDRGMYNITSQTVKEQTQCELSEVVEELSFMEFRRMLTYGEVSVESVSSTILPLLRLEADDIFYDLGCGTGKILAQALLQTPCRVAKGIELMQNRVSEGERAFARLQTCELPILDDKQFTIVQGDICRPPETADMMDATVVFINNVVFGPELMLNIMNKLSDMPNLKRVVTLRQFCVRHRHRKCTLSGSRCVDYVHPPEEAEIDVSWAKKTSVYLYERVAYSVAQLASQLQLPMP